MNEEIECKPIQHDFEIMTVAIDSNLPRRTSTLRFCTLCGKTSELVREAGDTFTWKRVYEEEATHNQSSQYYHALPETDQDRGKSQ